MSDNSNPKRIAVNTIVLYVRMIIVMFIALYTSRIVLSSLGVEDYGLYNVIGGVVSLFSFLRTTLEQGTQRFINFEMGLSCGNVKNVFSCSFTIHLIVGIITLILLETIGLWFINTYVNIPETRIVAANWVYQSVVLSLFVTILTVPFSADIVSHEKMTCYAIVSIIEAFLKLTIAFMISYDTGDKLILYSLLMCCISIVDFILYYVYARKHFVEARFALSYDRNMFRKMFSFTSWTFLGQTTSLAANQGNNILLNIFHGVTANAALGVGDQVGSALMGLSGGFQKAFNPQLTKSFAEKNFVYVKKLLLSASKLSFILMFICAVPIIYNIDFILKLWLVKIPVGASIFAILFIIQGVVNSLSTPLNFCIVASGEIKLTQIYSSIVYIFDLVLLYLLFFYGCPPATAAFVKLLIVIIDLFVRLHFACQYVPSISTYSYCKSVLFPVLIKVSLVIVIYIVFKNTMHGTCGICVATTLLVIISMLLSFFITLDSIERCQVKGLVISKLRDINILK